MFKGGSIKAPFPTLPSILLSMASRSAVSDWAVASSGKCMLYMCMRRLAWKRPLTSAGAVESYLTVSR